MKLLFIFLFISGISYSQGKVVQRHDNGQKKVVNVYTGTGISEKLTKIYRYDEHGNKPNGIITFSSSGWCSEFKEYTTDDLGKRYLWFKSTSTNGKTTKQITYKPDGTVDDQKELDHGVSY